jgi:GNAT superfamily N-acetyltransferase
MDEATIRPLGRPGDLGWVVMAHGELYAAELGWGSDFEALVARIVADFTEGPDPTRQAAWIAEVGSRRLGCVFCVPAGRHDDATAQLRTLLVHPDGRGHGLGTRLTAECILFARSAGYRRLRLWTTERQVVARAIYLAAGFVLIDEAPHPGFGTKVLGQTYELDLTAGEPSERRVRSA